MHKVITWYEIICPDGKSRNDSYFDRNEANLDVVKFNKSENGCGRGSLGSKSLYREGSQLDKGKCPSGDHWVRVRITRLYNGNS